MFSPPLARLIEMYQRLPGVGPKSAQRLAFHTLKQPQHWVDQFAQALQEAKALIKPCSVCFNWSAQDPCEICTAPERQGTQVCVVAETPHIAALDRLAQFNGLFHVLGGLISPLDGVTPEQLTLNDLVDRVAQSRHGENTPIEELILALPPTTEGDTTCLYLARLMARFPDVRVTRIAFGLPVGGDLDYADQLTLTRSLLGRQPVTL